MTRRLLLAAISGSLILASTALAQTPPPAIAVSAADSTAAPLNVGGDVLPPKLIHSVKPKLEVKRFSFHPPKSCVVLVGLTVPIDGVPTNVHTVRACNDAFDKAALDAISQYRFQPSTLHGEPVPVNLNVEVNFKIY
jgi:TonB family protein